MALLFAAYSTKGMDLFSDPVVVLDVTNMWYKVTD